MIRENFNDPLDCNAHRFHTSTHSLIVKASRDFPEVSGSPSIFLSLGCLVRGSWDISDI